MTSNDNEGLKQPYAPSKAGGTDRTGGETIGSIGSIGFIGYSAGHRGIVNCRP